MIIESPHPSKQPYPRSPVDSILEDAAKTWPDRTAAICEGGSKTFAELNEAASRVARGLRAAGIAPGDRVMLMAPNGVEFIEACFGILRAGAVVTPTNGSWKSQEIGYQLENSEAKAFFYHRAFQDEVDQVGNRGEIRIAIADSGRSGEHEYASFGESAPEFEPASFDPCSHLAALPYSSGTTGLPKGVMLTHANLLANVHQMIGVCAPVTLGPEDIYLNHLPYFHIYGFTCLMATPLLVGATQVIMTRFEPVGFFSLLAQHRPTVLLTVAPVLQGLLTMENLEDHDFSTIRVCTTGAAALPKEIARRFEERTGLAPRQGYGLTETSPVTNLTIPGTSNIETIGPPAPDTFEKIVDIDDHTRELEIGDVGELAIKGPQVMAGYWKAEEANRESLIDGWFLTGDIASQEADGSIRILDRKKEMIKYRGFAIAPAEVEAALLENSSVKDCAVVAFQHPEKGEVPKAFIVACTSDSTSAEALAAFMNDRLAHYKCPQVYEFIDTIPRNPAGKILRRVLVEQDRSRSRA